VRSRVHERGRRVVGGGIVSRQIAGTARTRDERKKNNSDELENGDRRERTKRQGKV